MNLLLFLGAGFSVSAGLPTQKQFLSKVNELRDKGIIGARQYSGVTAAYLLANEFDFESANMEEAFSMLDYIYHMKDDNFKLAYGLDIKGKYVFHTGREGIKVIDARRYFLETLIKVFGYNRAEKTYINQKLYDDFFDKLLNVYKIAVITTNYDLICESVLNRRIGGKALLFPYIYEDYNIGGTYIPAPLLKLHGSVDWVETSYDPPNVIPPTWSKKFERGGKYTHIWKQAENAISMSDKILIIGYNLVESDKHIKYLFHMGLSKYTKNIPKKDVYIVKPTWSSDNKKNYEFIQKSQKVRNFRVIELDFKKFTESDFLTILEGN